MRLNEIIAMERKRTKRVGRGTGSGHGKTSGKGHKGQKARSGGTKRPGFEGGQMPLFMRIPKKRGFKSLKPKASVSQKSLDKFKEGTEITKELLLKEGFVKNPKAKVKIVGSIGAKKKFKTHLKTTKSASKNFEIIKPASKKVKKES